MATAFDEAELLARVDNDITFLDETVQMLATDGASLMGDVRSAIEAGDAPALGRFAHALKGMISNFCAPAVQAAALDLEKVGKSGDLAAAPASAQRLEGQLRALTEELTAFVRARS